MNNVFDSVAISASAGCGKTEEMAMRLLRMFLCSSNRQEIFNSTIAVTFSKSGAKEIYNRMIELLFKTLLDDKIDEFNRKLNNGQQNLPYYGRDKLQSLMRDLIFSVNNLKICTIDSFMNKIVQSFATELGLPGKAELINESEADILKENVIKKLLIAPQFQSFEFDEEAEDIALESQKTSYGRNSRKYFSKISKNIEGYQRLTDDNPDAVSYDFSISESENFSIAKRMDAWKILEKNPTPNRTKVTQNKASLFETLEKIHTADHDTHFTAAELSRLKDFYTEWEALKSFDTSHIGSFTREAFSPDEISAIIFLLQYAAYILLKQNIVRSQAILSLCSNYRKIYAELFYKQGKLTFADLPRLLSNENNNWTYDIAYRLNNRFSNYLIDEFQDTSCIQYQVLDSIFDAPSAAENKSMFIVGDVKQAIYGWRSGDRRLMSSVIKNMSEQIGMKKQKLDVSFRYGQNICEALNLIFDGQNIENAGFFPGVGRAWANVFTAHCPSPVLKYRSKFEAFLPDSDENIAKSFADLILKRIKELDIIPSRRTCAILVRKNDDGINLLKELQQHPEYGEFFMWEGNDKIDNNKLLIALIHLLIYIQHPADTMAKEIASMLPCVRFLIPRTQSSHLRESNILAHDGFYLYLKECIRKIQLRDTSDAAFSDIETIELFLASAEEFDRSSVEKDSRIFKEFIKSVKNSKEAIGYKIRIMTAHHSKGLTFDHVFTAIFKDSSMVNREKNIPLAGTNPDGSKWLLNSVNEVFSIFPTINAAWNEAASEQFFEKLCLMYVALSRARYTMSLILPPLAESKLKLLSQHKSLSENKSYFLTDYISELLFYGEFETYMTSTPGGAVFTAMFLDDQSIPLPVIPRKTPPENKQYDFKFTMHKSNELKRRRIRPSDGIDNEEQNAGKKLYFNLPDESKGKNFGEKLHSALCAIEDLKNPSFAPDCPEAVKNEALKICSNPEIAALLSDYDKCWKERSFDVVIQNYYISGCFDRVQIKKDQYGKISSASIIDYKSGKHDSPDSNKSIRYHRQLNTYRMALSQLLRLPVNAIKCYIIWTIDASIEEVMP